MLRFVVLCCSSICSLWFFVVRCCSLLFVVVLECSWHFSVPIRGDLHVLVVGDPGLGKSQMLKACCACAPRSVYVTGGTTTATGLVSPSLFNRCSIVVSIVVQSSFNRRSIVVQSSFNRCSIVVQLSIQPLFYHCSFVHV
jgi:hypothetical protein